MAQSSNGGAGDGTKVRRRYLDIKISSGKLAGMKVNEDVSGAHVWLVLWKAWRALEAWDRRSIAASGLSLTDFSVLEVLLHKGSLPVNDIGRKVHLTSGSITTAITRLARRRLVARKASSKDARVVLVELTPKGRQFIQKVFGLHARNLESAFGVLSASERARLLALLRTLGKRAEALLAGGVSRAPMRIRPPAGPR